MDEGEYTSQERAAMIAYRLGQGAVMTTREIAAYCQMTYAGALYMMRGLSRLPQIRQDNGRWWMAREETNAKQAKGVR